MQSVDLLSLPDQRTAVPVPFTRHRRETRPGCLHGLLVVGGVLLRLALAGVKRALARLCRRIASVRTTCLASAAL